MYIHSNWRIAVMEALKSLMTSVVRICSTVSRSPDLSAVLASSSRSFNSLVIRHTLSLMSLIGWLLPNCGKYCAYDTAIQAWTLWRVTPMVTIFTLLLQERRDINEVKPTCGKSKQNYE